MYLLHESISLDIYPWKNGRAHMANLSILRNPAFESGLHGSPELFSGFSDGSFCPIFVSASIRIYENPRALKRVIDRGRLRIFIFHLDEERPHYRWNFRRTSKLSLHDGKLLHYFESYSHDCF